MAEQRLTNQDLVEILVKKHNLEKEEAETFIKEFFLLIEEALQKDGIAKVKGFGTFKLTEVKSRESINVNTGERFEIQGHTKVSFIPDPVLRDYINKPFAHFETIILNDGVTFDDVQDEENESEDIDDSAEEVIPEIIIDKANDEVTETISTDNHLEIPVNEEEVILPPPLPVTIETPEESEEISPLPESAEEVTEEETAEIEIEEKNEEEEFKIEKEIAAVNEENIESVTELEEQEKVTTERAARLPLEEIIARELQDTNRFFNKSIDGEVPEKSENEPKTTNSRPSKKFMIITIVLAIFICGTAVLFTYFPNFMDDIFGYKQPVNTVAQVSEGIDTPLINPIIADTTETTAPINEKKDSIRSDVEIVPVEQKKEEPPVVASVPKTVAPEKKQPVVKHESKPSENKAERIQPKVDPQTSGVVRDDSPVRTDSTSYKIIGTKTTHTIESGETLTRVSLRFYGTKGLWPYLVMHNKSKIPNPAVVPAGLTINIPELEKK